VFEVLVGRYSEQRFGKRIALATEIAGRGSGHEIAWQAPVRPGASPAAVSTG
jgi:hypothetical protein